jgi:hypothetical protein
MSYYGRGGNSYGSSRGKISNEDKYLYHFYFKGSYGNNRTGDRYGGNSLLDDLDSFSVGPLRPGPPVLKNFYTESPGVASRPQV